jgi:hypothetical protein
MQQASRKGNPLLLNLSRFFQLGKTLSLSVAIECFLLFFKILAQSYLQNIALQQAIDHRYSLDYEQSYRQI